MSKRTFGFVILILVVAGVVYYFSQNSTDTSQPQQQAQQVNEEQSVSADTVPAPEQPTIQEAKNDTTTKDTMPKPPPVAEEIAPGRALINATILSVEQTDGSPSRISINVNEILGYGSSTPPIAPDTDLSFDVQQILKANPQYSSMIQEEAEINMLIASQQGMQVNTSDQNQNWALVELKQ